VPALLRLHYSFCCFYFRFIESAKSSFKLLLERTGTINILLTSVYHEIVALGKFYATTVDSNSKYFVTLKKNSDRWLDSQWGIYLYETLIVNLFISHLGIVGGAANTIQNRKNVWNVLLLI
jgi:hypothetical protein